MLLIVLEVLGMEMEFILWIVGMVAVFGLLELSRGFWMGDED